MQHLRGAVLLDLPDTHWACPNCPVEAKTPGTVPNRFHTCRGAGIYHGLTAPMVPKGVSAKVATHEREDYVGDDLVQTHQGRPISFVSVETDESRSVTAFAPTATLTSGD
jgi:hypothetical protein